MIKPTSDRQTKQTRHEPTLKQQEREESVSI